MGHNKLRPETVAAEIRKASGLLTRVAQVMGVSRQTIANYCRRYPCCEKACVEAREAILDVAESKLLAKLNNGDTWAIGFILSTLGRVRGYVARQEVEHSGEIDSNIKVSVRLPPKQRPD